MHGCAHTAHSLDASGMELPASYRSDAKMEGSFETDLGRTFLLGETASPPPGEQLQGFDSCRRSLALSATELWILVVVMYECMQL